MEADPEAYAAAMGNPGGHYTDAMVIEAGNGAYHDVNDLIEEDAMYNMAAQSKGGSASYTMAAKDSHYSDAGAMQEANPDYHEVSPEVGLRTDVIYWQPFADALPLVPGRARV
jgi:hypothetical protein